MSEQTPTAPGDFGVGSHVAGYRLDEQIGRGGMAVVYRAYDARLERRVALKILAPELARDEEFRLRFIRESRAAAAVDHPNIIPIYQAGEADGVLFIAMRFVEGRDVHTLVSGQDRLPTPRVCDIVDQVASALDAAHAHGLVHRDVKPANMLREATSGRTNPDHIYLSDFGLSKHSLSGSAALTSQGQFLGTLNYVAPEQIEGRPVDGRTDEYALACSAFEMLAGQPPFRRDESLAIMWAQLSSAPPPLTATRPDLPAAVDEVMIKALAKAPDDRYASCLEFAAALRRDFGLGPGGSSPGRAGPGRGATRAVRPAELAAAASAAAASAAAGQPQSQPAAPAGTGGADTGQAGTGGADPGRPGTVVADMGQAGTGGADARPAGTGGADSGQAGTGMADTGLAGLSVSGPPTQVGPIQGAGPARPGLTDPRGDFDQLYRPPGAPPARPVEAAPRRGPRRTLATIAIACVVLAGAGGAYLLLGRGGGGGGNGDGTGTSARILALPECSTSTATLTRLRKVHTSFAQVGGKPFDVVVTRNHFGFVSLRRNVASPLAVMRTTSFVPTPFQNVPVFDAEGEVLTHDQQYLLVAGGSGLTIFRVSDLEAGLTGSLGSLTSPGGQGALQVVASPDDRFAFVALQTSHNVAVFNLRKALARGVSQADFKGMIPLRSDPTGMALSPDGRHLYVANGLADAAVQSGMGTLAIVDVARAEAHPGPSSVVQTIDAGCGPARVLPSPDGKNVWVTAGGANTLEAFSAAKLLSDPRHALIARVKVGQIPLGMALVSNGTRMVVADSNRENIAGAAPDLAVIDVSKALAGKPGALLGTIRSGQAPRQFALEPNGKTLLVTNTNSGELEAVNVGRLP